MRSTISTIAAVAAALFASTVSAQGQVAIYWGQGAYQKELSVVCQDPSVDIVNIAFVNGFPTSRDKYPDTNFGNACGGSTFPNPDGTASNYLSDCPNINKGIKTCKANGKKVLLSLGGGYPTNYYLANQDAALWLARVLIEGFGPKVAGSVMPRPFGDDVAVDGFDLDIESSTAVGDQKFQYYGEFVNIVKQLAPNMLISSAPQCVVPDAHLDKAIAAAPFDYVFVQFYNTDACSAAQGLKELKDKKGSAFTWNAWSQKLKTSANPNAKLFLGLPAGTNGANPNHYLTQSDANTLITELKKTSNFGGVMLWEATVSQNNTKFDQPYSQWIKYSIQGTFEENYHPVVSSTIRSSSTLVSSTRSSTRSSTPVITPSSTPASSKPTSSKASSPPYSTSSKVSSAIASRSSTPLVSSSSVPHLSKSSSVVLSSSYTVKTSSTRVITSSTVYPTSSSASIESSSSIHYSDYFSTASIPHVESSLSYSDYFSTAIPSSYSASSSVEPSTVYPDHVSSTVVSSSSAYVTSSASSVYVTSSVEVSSSASSYYETSSVEISSSASSVYETSSVPEVTSSASSYYEASSIPEITSSASSVYETSSIPEVTSSASEYSSFSSSSVYETSSVSEVTSSAEYSSIYSASSSKSKYETSSTTPADASSTSCTTSTESYKTPEASSSASEYYSYSESSKTPEASSSASEYSYSASYKTPEASSKTPEASTGYYSASSTGASSTPCSTSTELYPTSSETPEASSATDYSYYPESSKVPEVSSKASEYPSSYPTVSTKTPEVSSSVPYEIYSSSIPVSSAKSTEYIVVSPTPVESTKTPEASTASAYDVYSTASPSVTKPAESTTTVVTTTYLDTCSTGLTTKTTVITKTVCTACAKPSGKLDYPEDWTTSVYVSKTLTVTITKPIHPATDVPAYPTVGVSSAAPKPSAPAAEYPVGKEEVPSYETPAKSSSAPSYPEVPVASHEASSSAPAIYPTASVSASKPAYPEDATVTLSQYVTLTKVATPVAYATPIVHQGYPAVNGTVPAGTGAVKPSATGSYPVKPSSSSYNPPEFTGAAGKMSIGMTGVIAVVAFFVL